MTANTLARVTARARGHALWMLVALAVLTGCAVDPIALHDSVAVGPREGIVFGRIRVDKAGLPRRNLCWAACRPLSIVVARESSDRGHLVPLRDTGDFWWQLPGGGYRIAGFSGGAPGIPGLAAGRIAATFSVTPGAAVYIGTLVMKFSGSQYDLAVEDNYAAARTLFRENFGPMNIAVTRRLMELEARR